MGPQLITQASYRHIRFRTSHHIPTIQPLLTSLTNRPTDSPSKYATPRERDIHANRNGRGVLGPLAHTSPDSVSISTAKPHPQTRQTAPSPQRRPNQIPRTRTHSRPPIDPTFREHRGQRPHHEQRTSTSHVYRQLGPSSKEAQTQTSEPPTVRHLVAKKAPPKRIHEIQLHTTGHKAKPPPPPTRGPHPV
jgi:hypothetical protein